VLTLEQVAKYLSISEEDINTIIRTEENILMNTGSFRGKMFPYFIVADKRYFYKDEINDWVKEVSIEKRRYDFKNGTIR